MKKMWVVAGIFLSTHAQENQSFHDRYTIIKQQLGPRGLSDFDCNCTARLLVGKSKNALEAFCDACNNQTKKAKNLTIRDCEKTYYHFDEGAKLGWRDPKYWANKLLEKEETHQSAVHESAHLVGAVYHPLLIAFCGTI